MDLIDYCSSSDSEGREEMIVLDVGEEEFADNNTSKDVVYGSGAIFEREEVSGIAPVNDLEFIAQHAVDLGEESATNSTCPVNIANVPDNQRADDPWDHSRTSSSDNAGDDDGEDDDGDDDDNNCGIEIDNREEEEEEEEEEDGSSSDSDDSQSSIARKSGQKTKMLNSTAEDDKEEAFSSSGDEDDEEGGKSSLHPLKTEHELEEVADVVEEIEIETDKHSSLVSVGEVKYTIDHECVVVIEAFHTTNPLDEGSLLCNRHGRILGKIHEIFGPITTPYYIVRWNTDITANVTKGKPGQNLPKTRRKGGKGKGTRKNKRSPLGTAHQQPPLPPPSTSGNDDNDDDVNVNDNDADDDNDCKDSNKYSQRNQRQVDQGRKPMEGNEDENVEELQSQERKEEEEEEEEEVAANEPVSSSLLLAPHEEEDRPADNNNNASGQKPLQMADVKHLFPVGEEVFTIPEPAYCSYVMTLQLQQLGGKGSDASNAFDEEPRDEEREFSDDELEQLAKQRAKNNKLLNSHNNKEQVFSGDSRKGMAYNKNNFGYAVGSSNSSSGYANTGMPMNRGAAGRGRGKPRRNHPNITTTIANIGNNGLNQNVVGQRQQYSSIVSNGSYSQAGGMFPVYAGSNQMPNAMGTLATSGGYLPNPTGSMNNHQYAYQQEQQQQQQQRQQQQYHSPYPPQQGGFNMMMPNPPAPPPSLLHSCVSAAVAGSHPQHHTQPQPPTPAMFAAGYAPQAPSVSFPSSTMANGSPNLPPHFPPHSQLHPQLQQYQPPPPPPLPPQAPPTSTASMSFHHHLQQQQQQQQAPYLQQSQPQYYPPLASQFPHQPAPPAPLPQYRYVPIQSFTVANNNNNNTNPRNGTSTHTNNGAIPTSKSGKK